MVCIVANCYDYVYISYFNKEIQKKSGIAVTKGYTNSKPITCMYTLVYMLLTWSYIIVPLFTRRGKSQYITAHSSVVNGN